MNVDIVIDSVANGKANNGIDVVKVSSDNKSELSFGAVMRVT